MRRPLITLTLAVLPALASVLEASLPDGYGRLFLSAHASPAVRESAADLADILERTFGERPLILRASLAGTASGIHIGPAPKDPRFDDNPLTDEILVERKGKALHIRGSDSPSTQFAVYRFAEEFLGWHYFQPGALGLERLDSPPDPPPVRGPEAILLQTRAAYISRNPSFGNTPGPFPWEAWQGLRERFRYNHMVHRVVVPTLFDTLPDWFAKDEEGKPMRPPYYPKVHGYNDHPDLAHEAVREFVAEAVLEALEGEKSFPQVIRSPGSLSVSLSLGDSFVFGHYPEAYPWQADGYFRRWPDWSNHVFAFSNALAERVSEGWKRIHGKDREGPDLYFGTLAYLNWEDVPDFPVHPSIVPYLTFDRSQWYDPQAVEDDLGNVAAWNETEAPFLGTWDYLFGYGFLIPRSMTAIVARSIPALHERGVRAYFSQVAPLWPFDGHTNWLTARLLWNPDLDAEAELEMYFREFYGPAQSPMRAFFTLAESIWMNQDGSGWWLRYWKDPWQTGLWSREDITQARVLLRQAEKLAAEAGTEGSRFQKRVAQTRLLFTLTEALHDYQASCWRLAFGPAGSGEVALDLAQAALQARKRLVETRNRVVSHSPLMHYARDLEWVFRYDTLGAAIAAVGLASPDDSLKSRAAALLGEWSQLEGLDPIPLSDPVPVLHDTDLSKTGNRRIWGRQFMDSEAMSAGPTSDSGGFQAENVRRGHIYQLFAAGSGEAFLGEVEVETQQSLSGEIYIRLDFFDKDHQLLKESRRSRIGPVDRYGTRQRLRALMQAPEGTAYGRLFIRFYEMDPGSGARLHSARVLRVSRAPNP